jgi:hypothetical protein
LILFWTTHVGLVISCVRENVVGLPVFLDQGYVVSRKCLEFLLLRGSVRDDHFEARSDQEVLFALRLDVFRASRMSDELRDSEERMGLAAKAANGCLPVFCASLGRKSSR